MDNLNEVYITNINTYFPNGAISNDEMEKVLGYAGGKPSRSRAIVLRSNGIKNRYYSLNNEGKFTHTNAQLAAKAIEGLFDEENSIENLELIACGTSSPDMLLPGLASMVHGELESPHVELVSTSGACCTGIQALKYAYYAVKTGDVSTAVSTGSERVSQYLMGKKFDAEMHEIEQLEANGILAFDKDFLRWMLSDGAGAFLLQNKPVEGKVNLKIEWIEMTSFANELDTCMYLGADKLNGSGVTGFGEMEVEDWSKRSVFAYKQDVRLLGENIVAKGAIFFKKICDKRGITADKIDYFLPHLSSMFFWSKIFEANKELGIEIPEERWFVNLTKVGNVGAASAYAMLDELTKSGKLKKGERIMMFVPESARFSYAMVYLTVC